MQPMLRTSGVDNVMVNEGAQPAAKYDAFVSYSHAVDGKLAPAIQRTLHALGKPWYRLRALHIFRDETGLSANPALWPSIEESLGASKCLPTWRCHARRSRPGYGVRSTGGFRIAARPHSWWS